jgi:hypothetical protein
MGRSKACRHQREGNSKAEKFPGERYPEGSPGGMKLKILG